MKIDAIFTCTSNCSALLHVRIIFRNSNSSQRTFSWINLQPSKKLFQTVWICMEFAENEFNKCIERNEKNESKRICIDEQAQARWHPHLNEIASYLSLAIRITEINWNRFSVIENPLMRQLFQICIGMVYYGPHKG